MKSRHNQRVETTHRLIQENLDRLRFSHDDQLNQGVTRPMARSLKLAAERLHRDDREGPSAAMQLLGLITWGETRRSLEVGAAKADTARLALAGLHRFLTTAEGGAFSFVGEASGTRLGSRYLTYFEIGSANLSLNLGATHVTVSAVRDRETAITAESATSQNPKLSEADKWAIGWAQGTVELLAASALGETSGHPYSILSPYGSGGVRASGLSPIQPVSPDVQPPMIQVTTGQPEQALAIGA